MICLPNDPVQAELLMHSVIFYLLAFGYVDGRLDPSEHQFIHRVVKDLVNDRAQTAIRAGGDPVAIRAQIPHWEALFRQHIDKVDGEIRDLLEQTSSAEESVETTVVGRLKVRCFELFESMDRQNQSELLSLLDGLMAADGVEDEREREFLSQLRPILKGKQPTAHGGRQWATPVCVTAPISPIPKCLNHEFLAQGEFDLPTTPAQYARTCATDRVLVEKARELWRSQRELGRGKLSAAGSMLDLDGSAPFLDGHVYVQPPKPGERYELLVLTDLHGCYSCLKAALMQADFFAKVQAYHDDPIRHPNVQLIVLGDYIDRGRFGYPGVLRSLLQLMVTVPNHVFLLRGNHEYFVELNGRLFGGVRPSEATLALQQVAPDEVMWGYRDLFDEMPNLLVFDRAIFVHAGIPRDSTLKAHWTGLESLNHSAIRFEMMWSNPSEAEEVPPSLQTNNARFSFGRRQFESFMDRIGCAFMVRGHDRVEDGFTTVYDGARGRLYNLFSAGGHSNADLPSDSVYRTVRPKALIIRFEAGRFELTPMHLDYEPFNKPQFNRFFV